MASEGRKRVRNVDCDGCPEGKTLLAGKRRKLLDAFLHDRHLSTELMQPGYQIKGERQIMRMRQLACASKCCVALVQRLVRIAQEPQRTGQIAKGYYSGILRIEKGE